MDENYRLKRHTQLWEEQNKQIKRTVLAGLLFAAFILFNVLQPFSEQRKQLSNLELEIDDLQQQKTVAEASLTRVNWSSHELKALHQQIQKQPWVEHKNKLISAYREMRRRAEGTPEIYQNMADATINSINTDVSRITDGVLAILTKEPQLRIQIPELPEQLTLIPSTLASWTTENLRHNWYATIDRKDSTLDSLIRQLNQKFADVSHVLSRAQAELEPVVELKTTELTEKLKQLQMETTTKQQRLKDLEQKMEKILPQWVKGMITVEQMVQLYPLITLGITFYIFTLGIALTGHYRIVASDMKWSREERCDPAYSSLWTLTFRGVIGTTLTLAVYFTAFTCLWFFFEHGATIYAAWHDTGEKDLIGAMTTFSSANWIIRAIWLVGIVFILLQPIRDTLLWPGSTKK
ncbi:MAG: hypothetical protein ACI88A_001972 [Paraglaciecola sp.]|jgi:hypothetical protein